MDSFGSGMLPHKSSSSQHHCLTSQQVSFQDEQVNLSEVILGFSRASWLTVVLSDHSGFISIQLHSFLIANLYFVPILFFFLLMLPPDSFLKSNILASVAVPPMLFT